MIKKLRSSDLRLPPLYALRKSSNSHRLLSAGTARGTEVCLPSRQPVPAALRVTEDNRALTYTPEVSLRSLTFPHTHVSCHCWNRCCSCCPELDGSAAQPFIVPSFWSISSPLDTGVSRWTGGNFWDERLMQKCSIVRSTSGIL